MKSMNIAKTKTLLDQHTNMAYDLGIKRKNIDYTECHDLEQLIVQNEPVKNIMDALEIKMMRQYNIKVIIRLICLLSIT